MTQLRLHGLPNGPITGNVAQGGEIATFDTSMVARPPITSPHHYYMKTVNEKATDIPPTLSVTIENHGNAWHKSAGCYPNVHRVPLKAEVGHANRIISSEFTDSSAKPNKFTDATVTVQRMVNEVFTTVRTSRCLGTGNWGEWFKTTTKYRTTGLSFTSNWADWSALGETVWIGVAARGADNKIGPVSYVPFTPTSRATTSFPDDPLTLNPPTTQWQHGGAIAAPANVVLSQTVAGESTWTIDWDAVPGAEDYLVFYAYNQDPATFVDPVLGERYLDLEDDGGVPILPNDYITITKRIDKPSVDFISTRVWFANSAIGQFQPDAFNHDLTGTDKVTQYKEWGGAGIGVKPDPALGDMYAEAVINAGVQTDLMGSFWAGGQMQDWYLSPNPTHSYTFEFWVYFDRPVTCTFTTGMSGVPAEAVNFVAGWQYFSRTHSPDAYVVDTKAQLWELTVNSGASPLTFGVSQIRVYDAETEFQTLYQDWADTMVDGMYIRDHRLIKPAGKTVDVPAITNPAGESPRGTTLESLFKTCVQVNANPWIQIEWHLQPSEFVEILAYINAPYTGLPSDHPMAVKRHLQGRTAPWADAFDDIQFEFGNESWNGLGSFWNPPGNMTDTVTGETFSQRQVFGYIMKGHADAMMASEFWTDKIKWVIGGWAKGDYGVQAAERFGHPVTVGIAAYNGGWDENGDVLTETDQSYKNQLQNSMLSTVPRANDQVEFLKAMAAKPTNNYVYGENLFMASYESGPGYNLNGLNGKTVTFDQDIVQEVVNKSNSMGTATLDSFSQQALNGNRHINFFVIGTGVHWATHSPSWHSGEAHASIVLPTLVQERMGKYRIFGANTIADPLTDAKDKSGNVLMFDTLGVYMYESITFPGRQMLVVCNLSISDIADITIETNIETATSMQAWFHDEHYKNHNRYPAGFRMKNDRTWEADPFSAPYSIAPVAQAMPNDLTRFTIANMPAGATHIYEVEGVNA